MTRRRLVLTADDLGVDARTDDAILALLAEGLVTATSLIAVAPAAARAAGRLVRDLGLRADGRRVEPRLHATLTSPREGPAWRPLVTGAASLVTADGVLPVDPVVVGARAEPVDVLAELAAQLSWMRAAGLDPAAMDSHSGTLYGLHGRSFLTQTLGFCAEHGLALRLPRDPVLYVGGELPADLARAHRGAVELADSLGVRLPAAIVTNRRSAADLGGYDGLRDHYVRQLAALPEGVSELFMHPAPEEVAARLDGPDGVTRAWELRLLRDPVFTRALDREGLTLSAAW
ncbi:ChbG/HpnK family deacetylase [Actinotalea subterranea]|uniref:ChbG/HpnK family deacetylase n=1 Tax=Actinotalea subterranea TaxID=2607497 RepID=UPI0011F0028B|nr:ChbG/HpnK family deacetylase [Actinotalea subterranea]